LGISCPRFVNFDFIEVWVDKFDLLSINSLEGGVAGGIDRAVRSENVKSWDGKEGIIVIFSEYFIELSPKSYYGLLYSIFVFLLIPS
jgi:hypothetical protein